MKKLFLKIRGLFVRLPRFECLKCGVAISRVNFLFQTEADYPTCPICGKSDQVDVALGYGK